MGINTDFGYHVASGCILIVAASIFHTKVINAVAFNKVTVLLTIGSMVLLAHPKSLLACSILFALCTSHALSFITLNGYYSNINSVKAWSNSRMLAI